MKYSFLFLFSLIIYQNSGFSQSAQDSLAAAQLEGYYNGYYSTKTQLGWEDFRIWVKPHGFNHLTIKGTKFSPIQAEVFLDADSVIHIVPGDEQVRVRYIQPQRKLIINFPGPDSIVRFTGNFLYKTLQDSIERAEKLLQLQGKDNIIPDKLIGRYSSTIKYKKDGKTVLDTIEVYSHDVKSKVEGRNKVKFGIKFVSQKDQFPDIYDDVRISFSNKAITEFSTEYNKFTVSSDRTQLNWQNKKYDFVVEGRLLNP